MEKQILDKINKEYNKEDYLIKIAFTKLNSGKMERLGRIPIRWLAEQDVGREILTEDEWDYFIKNSNLNSTCISNKTTIMALAENYRQKKPHGLLKNDEQVGYLLKKSNLLRVARYNTVFTYSLESGFINSLNQENLDYFVKNSDLNITYIRRGIILGCLEGALFEYQEGKIKEEIILKIIKEMEKKHFLKKQTEQIINKRLLAVMDGLQVQNKIKEMIDEPKKISSCKI